MDLKEFGQNCINIILSLPGKVLVRVPEERRRLFIYFLCGLVFLCILLMVLVLARGSNKVDDVQTAASGPGIPAEELFYPAEPDVLPPLLLERWPQQPWTTDDLRPYWTDPGSAHEDKWREMAEAVIDRLMEGVP
jgi:hypothetical protein